MQLQCIMWITFLFGIQDEKWSQLDPQLYDNYPQITTKGILAVLAAIDRNMCFNQSFWSTM